eukprot:1163781-Prymnesium_polylepis.1
MTTIAISGVGASVIPDRSRSVTNRRAGEPGEHRLPAGLQRASSFSEGATAISPARLLLA